MPISPWLSQPVRLEAPLRSSVCNVAQTYQQAVC
jgi:hypothetical protein